jgi:undecaprenyl diphosphate synthase
MQGHWDGSKTLVDFAKWCIAEGVQFLSVYAFSTENWQRDPVEVASLMALFCKYCDELRIEAIERNIRIRVLSTETARVSKVAGDFECCFALSYSFANNSSRYQLQ